MTQYNIKMQSPSDHEMARYNSLFRHSLFRTSLFRHSLFHHSLFRQNQPSPPPHEDTIEPFAFSENDTIEIFVISSKSTLSSSSSRSYH